MKPSEIALFDKKDQTLLVSTESKRLDKLNGDDLGALLDRVRKGRNKYTDLHRRQSAAKIRESGKRASATTSNERTLRKAEIFEDAVSRVARHLSRAARATANDLKVQRLAAAKKAKASSVASKKRAPAKKKRPAGSKSGKKSSPVVKQERVGATSSSNKRTQARKDGRK